jgi:hypothetical protein
MSNREFFKIQVESVNHLFRLLGARNRATLLRYMEMLEQFAVHHGLEARKRTTQPKRGTAARQTHSGRRMFTAKGTSRAWRNSTPRTGPARCGARPGLARRHAHS